MEERLYDLIFICLPTTPEEEIAKIIGTIEHTVAERGGKVEKLEKWGAKKMAYRVAKQREGYYVYLALRSTQGELIKELERRLKVTDAVIKYMTIRLDEEIKRQQKLVARREQRLRRRPRKSVPSGPGQGGQGPRPSSPSASSQPSSPAASSQPASPNPSQPVSPSTGPSETESK
jgi:small subunit ribosomal protein S6